MCAGVPCDRVPLVVWGTGGVNTLVASSRVEAHSIHSTLDVLFQALVCVCGRYSKQLQ